MSNNLRANDVRVALPLFQEECGGSTPTLALHLHFEPIHLRTALAMNKEWHSRLPDLPFNTVNMKHGRAFGAIHGGIYYAIAIWSTPVARQLDDGETVELRRMAIADDAPKNTASRMLGWMVRELKKTHYKKAVSYQDTGAHKGTIYKAAGWKAERTQPAGASGWDKGGKRYGKRFGEGNEIPHRSAKVRWAISLQNVQVKS